MSMINSTELVNTISAEDIKTIRELSDEALLNYLCVTAKLNYDKGRQEVFHAVFVCFLFFFLAALIGFSVYKIFLT